MSVKIKLVATLIFAFAMAMPLSEISATSIANPQYNGHRGGNSRGGNPSNGNSNRPNGGTPNRPGGNHNPGRPNGGTPNRPGGNHNPGRPNGGTPNRPGGNHNPGRPSWGHNPGRPGNPGAPPPPSMHHRPLPPPPRPYRPMPRRYYRPVVPFAYVPYSNAPVINAILGLRFGMSLANSLVELSNSSYSIDGYNDSEVYLRNVSSMHYYWDDAILYYDSARRLSSISFYNSTFYNSTSRYDSLYSELCEEYGIPAVRNSNGSSMEVSWYDRTGNNFVTLSYYYGESYGGSSRYYTTLTFGN